MSVLKPMVLVAAAACLASADAFADPLVLTGNGQQQFEVNVRTANTANSSFHAMTAQDLKIAHQMPDQQITADKLASQQSPNATATAPELKAYSDAMQARIYVN